MKIVYRLLATGFYSGYFPIAPGSVGSAVALFIFWIVPSMRGFALLVVVVALFFIGAICATEVEKSDGRDASIINIDEIVGMWVSLLFLPPNISWKLIIAGFFIFRAFDIFKPFPINRSQNIKRGWGVMIDDLIAGIYTNLSLRIVLFLI